MLDPLPSPKPQKQPTGLTVWFELPGGRSVCASVFIEQDPIIPAPQEPDVRRMPLIHEWAEILAGLTRFEFTKMEPTFE